MASSTAQGKTTTGHENQQGGTNSFSNEEKQPKISLPKGGGAIQGMGEKFQVNPVTGTGSLSIPIAMSPGRSGFTPQLALSYDSGAGNSPFGMGWGVGLPSISRKTQKGIPRYEEGKKGDVFLLSGVEDLVPYIDDKAPLPEAEGYTIIRYRPRIEGLFARIEKWRKDDGSTFWKSITKENITTIYGQSDEAKVFHPRDKGKTDRRVFQWLIERTFDDKGNIIYYQYKKDEYTEENKREFPNTLAEENRKSSNAFIQRYLKKILYGNTKPYVSGGISHEEPVWNAWYEENKWLFELVFDYGEHQSSKHDIPTYEALQSWPHRPDVFSSFRSGFDIRTYRLCRRILMFHHFEKGLEEKNYLVRSTDLRYQEHPIATKLMGVTHTSYRYKAEAAGGYETAFMPEVSFSYSGLPLDDDLPADFVVEEVAPEYLDNLPQGIDGNRYRFQDLYGEGVSGILTQSNVAWYYKPNLGSGHFGALEQVAESPAVANLYQSTQQLIDIDGDGHMELVIRSQSLNGFYKINAEGYWANFRAFEANPNLNFEDPNLRLVDLNGDGHADILITENDCFIWYASLADEGFEAAKRISKVLEEEKGPRIVFNDGTQSIYLTDMTGDGLTDIVRIKNGNICYWANQGYGQFNAKIQMDNAPVFDYPDLFNQSNIRLSDIDGSGTTDIFYLGKGEVHYWHNESGNAWSKKHSIANFPAIDNLSTVQLIDIKGTGTASLVWSSPLAKDANAPLKYIDLMQEKPHLLTAINNNMGAVTKLEYKASTDFYLADKKSNTPWITKIPFPVHVLVRQETIDEISGNSFVTRYAYHHGYFDGEEREFRGFGLVEQWDTEDYEIFQENTVFDVPASNRDEITDVPPVYTKTWFHTGFYLDRERISNLYTEEYYRVPQTDGEGNILKDEKDNILYEDWLLADTLLPLNLSAEEKREACRALKGQMLRQEVYAEDRTEQAKLPYTVTENSYDIQCLQPKNEGTYGVFLVTPRESLSYHYERNPRDPRIAHSFNLVTDHYGNSTHVASIVYPRRGMVHAEEQTRLYATLKESLLTHPDQHLHWFRHSLPVASLSFEVHGLQVPSDEEGKQQPFAFDDLRKALFENFKKIDQDRIDLYPPRPDQVLDYAGTPADTHLQLRLLNRSLIQYATNNLDRPLETNEEIQSLAIPYETYTLAFTPGILRQDALAGLITADLLEKGGYVSDLTPNPEVLWWIPSGKTLFFYPTEQPEDSETKAALAAARFYLPVGEKTPLGKVNDTTSAAQESYVYYDQHEAGATDSYFLFVEKAEDPLENTMRVVDFDYRVLQARAMEDINNNRTEVAFDIHGMVIASAIRGKVDDNNVSIEGDELSAFQEVVCNPDESYLRPIMETPEGYLGNATSYFHYDLFAWQRDQEPTFALGLSREQHYRELEAGEELKIQKSIVYSDGFGREVLTKVPAEAGRAPKREEDGTLIKNENGEVVYIDTGTEGYPHNRWVGNGRTLFNNKGKPVKQYEPFFDSGYGFTEEDELREWGVTPVIHYDPLTRVIRTDLPDGTFSRVEFSPWHQVTYDPIDTLKETENEEDGWYQQKMNREVDQELLNRYSSYSVEERDRIVAAIVSGDHLAAQKSLALANTPSWQFLDTLGRPFVAIVHNKIQPWLKDDKTPSEGFIPTRTQLDIEGNPLFIFDGRRSGEIEIAWDSYAESEAPEPPLSVIAYHGNPVTAYAYAMNGLQFYQNSMDAGEKWSLPDVMGSPLHTWSYQTVDAASEPEYIHSWVEYDALQRPTHLRVQRSGQQKKLVEQLVYGEDHPAPFKQNLRGALLLHLDGAGLLRNEVFDFKGNLQKSTRWLATDYQSTEIDWAETPISDWMTDDPPTHTALEPRPFTTENTYDALSRIIKTQTPDKNQTLYTFNKAGLLEKVQGQLIKLMSEAEEPEAYEEVTFVKGIDYNEKGQRIRIRYGNDVITRYSYAAKTFRLERLWSFRKDQSLLQDIAYTYDAVGNITQIYDIAQPTIFTNNTSVPPEHKYTYDGLYQLTEAWGRESKLIQRAPGNKETIPQGMLPDIPVADNQVRNYREYYRYDEAGNILSMQHVANGGSWTRQYAYEAQNNRLRETTPAYCQPRTTYPHDKQGNITAMPHLHRMDWDYKDQLTYTSLVPECSEDAVVNDAKQRSVYFTYDTDRQRVRKRYQVGNQIKERIYLGAYETYRLQDDIHSNMLQSLHINDDKNRICLVETTQTGKRYYRYQLANHLGSASMEVDKTEAASIITYEEYHPYGTSAFRARKSGVEVSAKRYRYTGMERDEETGLNYHGARYYLSWLGRWCSGDPKGLVDGGNFFRSQRNNPIKFIDRWGFQGTPYEDIELENYDQIVPYNGEGWGTYEDQIESWEEEISILTSDLEKRQKLLEDYEKKIDGINEKIKIHLYGLKMLSARLPLRFGKLYLGGRLMYNNRFGKYPTASTFLDLGLNTWLILPMAAWAADQPLNNPDLTLEDASGLFADAAPRPLQLLGSGIKKKSVSQLGTILSFESIRSDSEAFGDAIWDWHVGLKVGDDLLRSKEWYVDQRTRVGVQIGEIKRKLSEAQDKINLLEVLQKQWENFLPNLQKIIDEKE